MRKPFTMDSLIKKLNYIMPKGIVLIADDDPDFSTAMEEFFNENGYRVLIANDGQKALDYCLSSSTIDVLVLDLKLPVIHGLNVYMELQEKGRTVPTFIVTGYATEDNEHIDILRSLAVTGCLLKPFHPEELLQKIENKLSRNWEKGSYIA